MHESFASLQAHFKSGLAARTELMQGLLQSLEDCPPQDSHRLLQQLRHEAHKLNGAAGSYQMPALSAAAQRLEQLAEQALHATQEHDQSGQFQADCQQAMAELLRIISC